MTCRPSSRSTLLLILAAAALTLAAGCKKKSSDNAAGTGTGTATGSAGSGSGSATGTGATDDDPWATAKPRNADAPPPREASRLGAKAGSKLKGLDTSSAKGAAMTARVSASSVARDGLPSQSVKSFAGIQQRGFRVAYATSKDEVHEQFRSALQDNHVFELVAQGLNQTIRMPATVDIQLVDCEEVNAFYDPDTSRIIVCYELLAYFLEVFQPNVTSDEQLGQAVIGATLFSFYHELGHALVHQLELPTMGRQEDTADQIATLLLMAAGDDGVAMALSGAYWFHLQQQEGSNETPFWDEHAFDGQRYYNIMCLIYGSEPDKFADFVSDDNLPEERAERCPTEYQEISTSFDKLMAPHLTGNDATEIDYAAPIADTPAAPATPRPAEAGHQISCQQVADKAVELIRVEAFQQMATLPTEAQEAGMAEIRANLPAFLEEFLAECAKEDWSDPDRQCVLDASSLDEASRCGIE